MCSQNQINGQKIQILEPHMPPCTIISQTIINKIREISILRTKSKSSRGRGNNPDDQHELCVHYKGEIF